MVACGGLRKRDEGFELGASRTAVNGFCGEAHAVEKIRGAARGDQRARGIRQDYIAVRAMLVVERRACLDTLWMISALYATSPPRIASSGARRRPKSSGTTV